MTYLHCCHPGSYFILNIFYELLSVPFFKWSSILYFVVLLLLLYTSFFFFLYCLFWKTPFHSSYLSLHCKVIRWVILDKPDYTMSGWPDARNLYCNQIGIFLGLYKGLVPFPWRSKQMFPIEVHNSEIWQHLI